MDIQDTLGLFTILYGGIIVAILVAGLYALTLLIKALKIYIKNNL